MADAEAGNTTCSSDQLLCQDNLNFPPTLYCLTVTDNYTCAVCRDCFQQCPQLKANPDIAGIGASTPNPKIHIKLSKVKVIASFIISAGLTLIFSTAYLLIRARAPYNATNILNKRLSGSVSKFSQNLIGHARREL